jgi:hypothetical protein
MIVPITDFVVERMETYDFMASMTTVLPNLQQITHCHLGHGHKFSDGDDPVEYRAADLANWTAHDINFISNFRKLRSLKFFSAPLNGRYPFLFNFPLSSNHSTSAAATT